MRPKYKGVLVLILICTICIQLLTACNKDSNSIFRDDSTIEETKIDEKFVSETSINEEYLEESYIAENLIYEDGIYEYMINESLLCEAYTFEVVVGETSEEEILSQLPAEIDEYEIDWPKVIGKFAVGTTIIIATGVVHHYVKSSYFVVASPVKVATEAVLGGAIEATLKVVLEADKDGVDAEQAVTKYAIEGFADGYMWGAITSVLSVMHTNFKLPKSLTLSNGVVGKIATDGTVLDSAGNVLGKAYFSKNGIYVLNELGNSSTIELFDTVGKQIVSATPGQAKLIANGSLPANTVLRLGTDATAKVIRTDATGTIYRVGNDLVPNVTYKLGNYVYKTDKYGRIIEASFDKLELKPEGQARKIITNTLSEIGKGSEKTGIDDRGHLIADQFKGNNSLANIVSMNGELNKGEYKALEELWADSIRNGKNVSGTIKLEYSGTSYRPDTFDVLYDLGDGVVEKVFTNL